MLPVMSWPNSKPQVLPGIRRLEKQPKFEGRQTDQWHITSSGSISAHCSLSIDNPPAGAVEMPISLPYEAGKLQSAKIGGRELRYEDLGKGRYELTLPTHWASSGNPTIEFVWTISLDCLERDAKGFRAILSGVVPVYDYSLDVILDEGCGYELTDRLLPFDGAILSTAAPRSQSSLLGLVVCRFEKGDDVLLKRYGTLLVNPTVCSEVHQTTLFLTQQKASATASADAPLACALSSFGQLSERSVEESCVINSSFIIQAYQRNES